MLLTLDEYRALHPESTLEDEALQMLLDAAEADVNAYLGIDDEGAIVEWFTGGRQMIALSRPATSITSIVEHSLTGDAVTTLDPTDYLAAPGGYLLYRDGRGVNRRWAWYGRVVVTYAAADTEAQRRIAQSELILLTESYAPGLTSETVGSWTQQYSQVMGTHEADRTAILSRLSSGGRMLVAS